MFLADPTVDSRSERVGIPILSSEKKGGEVIPLSALVNQRSNARYLHAWQTPSEQQAPHLSQVQIPVLQQPQSQPLQAHWAQLFPVAWLGPAVKA